MKKEIYNYQYNKKYSLNKINIYAYSFFDTQILQKEEEFIIDLDSIISNISSSINESNDLLDDLRTLNHEKYYKIDTKFLREVDNRYKKIAKKILDEYNSINSFALLTEKKDNALEHQVILKHINQEIEVLKDKIKEDLMVIVDYVDRDEKLLDLSFIDDDNPSAKALKKKYDAILLQKSVMNLNNLNLEMERQQNRLTLIRQLIPLSKRYADKRNDYLKEKYNEENTAQLKENLSLIIDDYIFLLSHQEFHDLRKVFQGILNHDYTFVYEFLYTYKIIVDKIWKYTLTDIDNYQFDFYYLVSSSDVILNSTKIELMNRKNMHQFATIGYICKYDGNICDVFDIDDNKLLNIKLPKQINNSLKFEVIDKEKISVIGIYNIGNKSLDHQKYPVIDIN